MKRLLPVLFTVVTAFVLLHVNVLPVFAQTTPQPNPVQSGDWVQDAEVTFVGKAASRANDFLNWTLQNYNWASINTWNPQENSLIGYWLTIVGIVYLLLILVLLAAAFIMIITKGENVTVMKFMRQFIFVAALIILTYPIISFIYGIVDLIQGFFLRSTLPSGPIINSRDLLHIAFNYDFVGYRRVGMENDESAFISLLLVKLTAITYYVMTGILLMRKIILWFFLIVAPVFPLLLFFRPIRNTAKIWIGEFFRWVLYAPLFAIFLHGLVVMWRNKIPLPFQFDKPGGIPGQDIVYPTAVSILLGGPGQAIGINNSVNLQDTFALYVVALLMLWVVIFLPFLLLKIFLDYLNNIVVQKEGAFRQVLNKNFSFLGGPSGPLPPSGPPGKTQPTGLARQLPFMSKRGISLGRNISTIKTTNQQVNRQTRELVETLRTVNVSIPKMTDVVRYETAMLSQSAPQRQEVSQMRETLQKIANPTVVTTPIERQKYVEIREKLTQEKMQGNKVAGQILAATGFTAKTKAVDVKARLNQMLQQIVRPERVVLSTERKQIESLKHKLEQRKEKGDLLATTVLLSAEKAAKETAPEVQKAIVQEVTEKLEEAKKQGDDLATDILTEASSLSETQKATLPVVNTVQQVSLEDYEEVRKMWQENYKNLEPPKGVDGDIMTRQQWVESDINRINEAITLLTAMEPVKVNQGMEMVSNILPFLLIGGFSKSEVIAYLKAKLEAAKSTVDTIREKEEEEDTMLERETVRKQEAKAEVAARALPLEEEPKKELEKE